MNQMLDNPWMNRAFVTLYHHNQVVACGLGMIERKFIGIFDVITNIHYRNQEFGEQLLNLLQWGRDNGADHSYLAVKLNNKPALQLYRKLGFQEIYKYWYRVK